MNDSACRAFLQWALPRLHLQSAAFRNVRRQVCRRIAHRLEQLELDGPDDYRRYLGEHPGEWPVLDDMCRITVSRFYRDRLLFDRLADTVLPALAARAERAERVELRAWCAGCASGEEAWSLRLLWDLRLAADHPDFRLTILATDTDEGLLERAERAAYPASSLVELPDEWREAAFTARGDEFELKLSRRHGVAFRRLDVRRDFPDDTFDLVLCRNLAFTYFTDSLQRDTAHHLAARIWPGGALVLGDEEALPPGAKGFEPWPNAAGVYRRTAR